MHNKNRAKPKPRWSTSLEPQGGEVLNAIGAGRLLGVTKGVVLKLVRTKKLPGQKVGKEWRFSRVAILEWLGTPQTRGKGGRPA
jgi:excisionase family DNA binding protein